MMNRHIKCAAARFLRPIRRPSAHVVAAAFLSAILFNSMTGWVEVAKAQDNGSSAGSEAKKEKIKDEDTSGVHEQTFDITAYYSPLADQNRYVTGSYASDIRLNGGGVHGADGTPVYPGMVAAPSRYAFGTKLNIPGIGTVAVHDRGGAIVSAGNSLKYDRLDIWMGRGDEGLDRALSWGRRVVKVTVYGVDPSINEEVSFKNLVIAEYNAVRAPAKPAMFGTDIWNLSHGAEVVKLQKTLESLGYFKTPITGFYGPETRMAVYQFQKDHGIFTDENELGAGHTGPQTRIALEKAFVERRKSLMPGQVLGKGSQGENVSKLQQLLKSLGYDVKITSVFDDQTAEAIFQFQKDQKIVASEYDRGAGYFGGKTLAALEKEYIGSIMNQKNVAVIEVPDYLVQDLSMNASGDTVRQLQQELKRLNFLRIDPTGNYGTVTAHAVFKFQQSQGLVTTISEQGAQVFGPETRARLNQIIAARFYHLKLLAEKKKAPSLISLR